MSAKDSFESEWSRLRRIEKAAPLPFGIVAGEDLDSERNRFKKDGCISVPARGGLCRNQSKALFNRGGVVVLRVLDNRDSSKKGGCKLLGVVNVFLRNGHVVLDVVGGCKSSHMGKK